MGDEGIIGQWQIKVSLYTFTRWIGKGRLSQAEAGVYVNAQSGDEGLRFFYSWFACPRALQIIGLSNPFLSPEPGASFKTEGKEKQRRIYVPHKRLRRNRGKFLGCLDHTSLMVLRNHSAEMLVLPEAENILFISPCWRNIRSRAETFFTPNSLAISEVAFCHVCVRTLDHHGFKISSKVRIKHIQSSGQEVSTKQCTSSVLRIEQADHTC